MLGSGGGVQPPQGQMSCSGGGGVLCDLLGPPPWDQSAELPNAIGNNYISKVSCGFAG